MRPDSENRRARSILWFDSGAALCAGAAVLILSEWLAQLHGLDRRLVVFIGATNLLYGTYSGLLATIATVHATPRRRAVEILVVANVVWTFVCALMLARFGASASVFAWLHLGFEGLFVAGLAGAEWRWVRPAAREH